MKEILDLKLTPKKEQNKEDNTEVFKFIEKISNDQELFKRFITELVEKYIKMMDQKSALQDSKIADLKVSVHIDYDGDGEGLKIT